MNKSIAILFCGAEGKKSEYRLLNNFLIYKPPPINMGNEKSKKRNSKSKCSICLFIYRILLSLFRGIESNGELSYPKIYILDLSSGFLKDSILYKLKRNCSL